MEITVAISTKDDDSIEPTETFFVVLSADSREIDNTTINILDNDRKCIVITYLQISCASCRKSTSKFKTLTDSEILQMEI